MVICLSGFEADILCNHPVWLCDGTFKSTQTWHLQINPDPLLTAKIKIKNCSKSKYILLFKVYNILAKPESAGGAGIPCVYALFPQEMATYLKMFSIIKENWEIVASYLQLFLTLKGLYLGLLVSF